MINDATGRQSTPSLMADAFAHLSRLLETEIRLVRKELSEKITEAVRAVAILAVSAVLLLTALIIILQGIVELLVYFGMQPFAASFTVGIVIAIVGAIAIFIAMRSLKGSNLAPSRTVDQLGKDVHVLKDQIP
jgi:uncharacterized membrane protein YqjE